MHSRHTSAGALQVLSDCFERDSRVDEACTPFVSVQARAAADLAVAVPKAKTRSAQHAQVSPIRSTPAPEEDDNNDDAEPPGMLEQRSAHILGLWAEVCMTSRWSPLVAVSFISAQSFTSPVLVMVWRATAFLLCTRHAEPSQHGAGATTSAAAQALLALSRKGGAARRARRNA